MFTEKGDICRKFSYKNQINNKINTAITNTFSVLGYCKSYAKQVLFINGLDNAIYNDVNRMFLTCDCEWTMNRFKFLFNNSTKYHSARLIRGRTTRFASTYP